MDSYISLQKTDHKLLIPILNNKHLIDMTPRIQQMMMHQLKFSFEALHVKATELNDADAGLPLKKTPNVWFPYAKTKILCCFKKITGLEIMTPNCEKIQHVSKLIELLFMGASTIYSDVSESRQVGRMFKLVNPKHKDRVVSL